MQPLQQVNELTEVRGILNKLVTEALADFVTDHENMKTRCRDSAPFDVYLDVMVEATAPRVLSSLVSGWVVSLKATRNHQARDAVVSALLAIKTYLDGILALEPPSAP